MSEQLVNVDIDLIKELKARGKYVEAQELFNKYQEVAKKNIVEGKIANKRLENKLRHKRNRYANKDKINASWRAYYPKNKERILAGQKKRKLANPEKYKAYQKKYRLRKKLDP